MNPDGEWVGQFEWDCRSHKLEHIGEKYYFVRECDYEGRQCVIITKHEYYGYLTNKRFEDDENYGHMITIRRLS